MCKLFAITDMSHVSLDADLISAVRDAVCATSDKDGFGYSVQSKAGVLGGERTIRPLTFNPAPKKERESRTKKTPIVLTTTNRFGYVDTINPKSLIGHGRFSTNSVSLENTHPFVNKNMALIHNGVVSDTSGTVKNTMSTCDSELLLKHWELGGVASIEKHISGYYAILAQDTQGKLHMVRDSKAMLYLAYSRTARSFLLATTVDIIESVCEAMEWKHEDPEEVLSNRYVVFDGNTIVSHTSITPQVSAKILGSWEQGAFGEEAESMTYRDLTDNYHRSG